MTIHPAWQLGLDDAIGSLEVGKHADLVILHQNPRTVDPDAIRSIKVLEIWVGGQRQPAG